MIAFLILLFFVTTFAATGLAVIGVWFAIRKRQEIAAESAEVGGEDESQTLLRDDSVSTISIWASLLERFDFVHGMRNRIAQAGLDWSAGRVTLGMLLAGSAVLAVLVRVTWLPLWAAAALAGAAAIAPYLYVLRLRSKRFRQFEAQFPDALDSLARALRAGHPFAAALEIVANEAEAPVSLELRRTCIEASFGMSWKQALDNLTVRVPLIDVQMFAAAAQLQSRTGGKLNEVLTTVSESMRESVALKGEVRALAAHGKLTGLVLTILPAAIALIMAVVSPEYLGVLIASPDGKYLIAGSIGCLIAAHFIIRRITDVKI